MEEKKNNNILLGILIAIVIFGLGALGGYYYQKVNKDNNKPDDTQNKPVEKNEKPSTEDYTKYVGKNWADEDNTEWFNILSIENESMKFSWSRLRLGGVDAELPFKDGKTIFYYNGYEDRDYNTVEDEGEHFYRKGIIELKDNKVYINLEAVTREEFENNLSLDVTETFGGSVYFDLKDYVYSEVIPENVEPVENVNYSTTVWKGEDDTRTFVIEDMGNDYITFTWYLTNRRIHAEKLYFHDGVANFFYSGYSLKDVERRDENIDQPYYKRGIVKLVDDTVHVTIENVSYDVYVEGSLFEIATLQGLNHDITPGEFIYTKSENNSFNDYNNNANTSWRDKSGRNQFIINTIQDDMVSITWNMPEVALIQNVTLHKVDGKILFYYYTEPDDLKIHIYRKGTIEIVNNEMFITLQNVTSDEYYENIIYDISSSFEGRENLGVGTYSYARENQ